MYRTPLFWICKKCSRISGGARGGPGGHAPPWLFEIPTNSAIKTKNYLKFSLVYLSPPPPPHRNFEDKKVRGLVTHLEELFFSLNPLGLPQILKLIHINPFPKKKSSPFIAHIPSKIMQTSTKISTYPKSANIIPQKEKSFVNSNITRLL